MVSLHYLLHLFFPLDFEFLTGLLTVVRQVAVLQLVGLQHGQVHERNAAQVKTHQIKVSDKGHFGILSEIQVLNVFHGLDGEGSLGGFVHAGIDFREGVTVYGQLLFHGPGVNGP